MVRDDDSVDSVWDVAKGLAKAVSNVGDKFLELAAEVPSSWMGDTRWVLCWRAVVFAGLTRARCCCCSILNCRLRKRSISSSSGEAFPDDKAAAFSMSVPPSSSTRLVAPSTGSSESSFPPGLSAAAADPPFRRRAGPDSLVCGGTAAEVEEVEVGVGVGDCLVMATGVDADGV
jgi:hypothetical protein